MRLSILNSEPKNIVEIEQEYKDPGRPISILCLLYYWGSLRGVILLDLDSWMQP